MIFQYVDGDHKNWDKYLPEIVFAYNTAISSTTGFTSAYLNTGRELIHPQGLYRKTREKTMTSLPDCIQRIKDVL